MYKLAARNDAEADLTDEELDYFYDLLEERYDVFNDFFPIVPNDELWIETGFHNKLTDSQNINSKTKDRHFNIEIKSL